MNQILQVEEAKNIKKTIHTKSIVLFFILVIIIFGLILFGKWVYEEITNGHFTFLQNIITSKANIPKITFEKTEENKLIINIESQTELEAIEYRWNDETTQIIRVDGITNMEKILNIPTGENTIYVVAKDINGKESQKQEKYIIETPKPLIDLSVIGNKIKISVISEIELSEVAYAWNTETEKIENLSTYVDRTKFEKEIEIPIGQNTLKIAAVDVNGSKTEKSQEIKGVTKAITSATVVDDYWHFTVVGKENIKSVEFEFNGQRYLMDKNTFGETKSVHYKVKLKEGKNYLKIISTTESDGVDSTSWEYEYRATK